MFSVIMHAVGLQLLAAGNILAYWLQGHVRMLCITSQYCIQCCNRIEPSCV